MLYKNVLLLISIHVHNIKYSTSTSGSKPHSLQIISCMEHTMWHSGRSASESEHFYIVTVISESLESNLSITLTSNASLQLTLFSDQDYNISVVASNCLGTSEPFEICITADVNDSGIIIFCCCGEGRLKKDSVSQFHIMKSSEWPSVTAILSNGSYLDPLIY